MCKFSCVAHAMGFVQSSNLRLEDELVKGEDLEYTKGQATTVAVADVDV